MGWIGPTIAAAGSVLGGMMGQQNVKATNAANMALNEQMEGWETQMSDTAMTRRVADLNNAGLNPLLAVSEGGASTPGFSPIPMQTGNPLGAGIANAANVGVNTAQLANLNADTQVKQANAGNIAADTANKQGTGPLGYAQLQATMAQAEVSNTTVQSLQQDMAESVSRMGLNDANVKQAMAMIDNIESQNPGIKADSFLKEMNARQQGQLYQVLVNASRSVAESTASSAAAQNQFNNSIWGRIFHSIVGGSSPSSVVGAAAPFLK